MLTVTRVPIDRLLANAENPRLHNEVNLHAIEESLAKFGQAEPLVVQASSQRVVGGNGRLVAMKSLGWTECDVVELDLDDAKATALGIALNRTAELASWDGPVLARLLQQLEAGQSLDGTGYAAPDVDALIKELEAQAGPRPIEDPGPAEPPAQPVARTGDLWRLGEHRLLCGSSTEPTHVARLLGDERPKLFATDPPYCVAYTGNNRPIHDGKSSGKDWSAVYREIDIADYGAFVDGFLDAYLPRIDLSAPIYVWHAHTQQHTLHAAFERHSILFHQVLVWVKPTPVFTHCYFQWQHEPCAFGWVKGNKPTHGIAQLSTVWQIDWEGKQRVVGNEHPTQKPLRLFEIPMELHTKPGDLVVEPFSGSGSQIVAAERLGRRCYAMEIQPAFVDVAINRWQDATKQQATLDDDGRTLATVAQERLVS